jgi:hypothetical protein
VFKKLLIAAGLGGLVYWLTSKRGNKDEFTFTEVPPNRPGD